ncbi:MAG: hypothetical protein GWM87_11040, partial [Xanthomonadales bacterium]|nr:hypothetical protein [Xanthomonadales bacterium]NIX13412.1 hypothetical protein [Xanthomonadales bacterium]
MPRILRVFISSAALLVSAQAWAEPLFDSHDLLELSMPVDFEALCRPSEDPGCDYTPTVFGYRDADGVERTVPIEIRRRDGWRAQQTNCQVPTLFVRFDEAETAGTPFEGQTELALTSHCGKGVAAPNVRSRALPDQFESYVINEYLGYRMFNLVTDFSLRVRLLRIRYTDPDNPRRYFTRDAFFAEHFESLAERLGAELMADGQFDPGRLGLDEAVRLALFQYMIGNTDWSIAGQDNVILLQMPGGRQVPVLYDLDQSGLVNAHYARPAPGLPIRTVKQRHYLGYCHAGTDWEALFSQFRAARDDIISLLVQTPGFGRGERRMTGAYLDS